MVDNLDAAGMDQAIGKSPSCPIRNPAAQLETASAGTHFDWLGGKPRVGLEQLAGPCEGSSCVPMGRSPRPPARQQTSNAGVAASAVELAHKKTHRESCPEPEQGKRQQLPTGVALNPSCDSELHSVNLIPSITPENRAE
jgi:hypothetical protein